MFWWLLCLLFCLCVVVFRFVAVCVFCCFAGLLCGCLCWFVWCLLLRFSLLIWFVYLFVAFSGLVCCHLLPCLFVFVFGVCRLF